MPENNIILIITTRNYPLVIWEKFSDDIIKWDLKKLAFDAKPCVKNSKDVCIKTLRFNNFRVFVVPCLEKNVSDEDRRGYLEYVISTICPNINDNANNVYLFAHDRDFNKNKPGLLGAESDVPQGNTPIQSLSKLVEARSIYLFQHSGYIGDVMSCINQYSDDHSSTKFGEKQCKELFYIFATEQKMCDFFQSTNTNADNRYPTKETEKK